MSIKAKIIEKIKMKPPITAPIIAGVLDLTLLEPERMDVGEDSLEAVAVIGDTIELLVCSLSERND